jgi:hypothetical protein
MDWKAIDRTVEGFLYVLFAVALTIILTSGGVVAFVGARQLIQEMLTGGCGG